MHTCTTFPYIAVTFNPDNQFTMKALSRLEKIGITNLRELNAHKQPLQSVIGIEIDELPMEFNSLLNMWLQGRASLHPTWRHFLWVLREIKLNHLAEQIEVYLNGVAVEQAATSNLDPSPGSEEEDKEKESEANRKLRCAVILACNALTIHVGSSRVHKTICVMGWGGRVCSSRMIGHLMMCAYKRYVHLHTLQVRNVEIPQK